MIFNEGDINSNILIATTVCQTSWCSEKN